MTNSRASSRPRVDEADAKREREGHPGHRPTKRLAEADDMGLPMKDPEVQREQGEDENDKTHPNERVGWHFRRHGR